MVLLSTILLLLIAMSECREESTPQRKFFDASLNIRHTVQFVNCSGEKLSHNAAGQSAEVSLLAGGTISPILQQIRFPDPEHFISGNLANNQDAWRNILTGEKSQEYLSWVTEGVNIHQFIQPFAGHWGTEYIHAAYPMRRQFQNAKICEQFQEFISRTLIEDITSGAISVLGRAD